MTPPPMNSGPPLTLIEELATAPERLRVVCAAIEPARLRVRPAPGRFAPIEDAWHLFDIEQAGYLVRIRRLLDEREPELPGIDGDRLAIERRYLERDLEEAIAGFARARAQSVALIRPVGTQAWQRTARFDGHVITLRDLVTMLVQHDREHLASLQGQPVIPLAA